MSCEALQLEVAIEVTVKTRGDEVTRETSLQESNGGVDEGNECKNY